MNENLNLHKHISSQFNDDLERVKTSVLAMGGLVEAQINDSITALIEGDSRLAQKVRDKERAINSMELDIDAECATILALRQPAASDLRMLLAALKSITDIERMGDEAKHIASFAIKLSEDGEAGAGYKEFEKIGKRVRKMTSDAFNSFARFDVELARSVVNQDRGVDSAYHAATEKLLSQISDHPENLSNDMNVMWSLRSLERIGDHCINIAEYVIYLVEGDDVRHSQSKTETKSS
ncbi:MAG TPA: phosphate transport system regulatory protein PhoU [Gammaproteobacteria bacterium]|mgnify:CR=1 FL=1|jgi:phosphate transport system protein|nr:phosphate signaling complex protein PhoU [Pseudomonadota bacterium]HAY46150.1 phosphate transport system regulatory protein PhoU [Gammaproteobacteria bacterium]